jgi:hypothetical protein
MDGFTMSEKAAAEAEGNWKKLKADYDALGGYAKEGELERELNEYKRQLSKYAGAENLSDNQKLVKETLSDVVEFFSSNLKEIQHARKAMNAAYSDIPEFAKLHGSQAYGKEQSRREVFNKGLDDTEAEKKKAWDEARVQAEAQAEALRRQDELFAQWSEGESALLKQKIADNADARRQDELKREHEGRMARLRDEVGKLSESALKNELARLRGLSGAEGDVREKGRRDAEAGVVLAEVDRREQEKQGLARRLLSNVQASGAQQRIIEQGVNTAIDVYENGGLYSKEMLAKFEKLARLAEQTPGTEDDSVMKRILDYMADSAQAFAKSRDEMTRMAREMERLRREFRAGQRSIAK